MQRSPIQWTHFTANPLRYRDPDGNVVHACIHKSGGCLHCYAEALAGRWGRAGRKFTAENMKRLTPFLDEKELRHMLTYKPATGKMCFVGDMTDIFGEWVSDDLLNHLFTNVLEMRENVTWQLLTKRADRLQRYLSWRWGEGRIPMRNIWIGVSVEDQKAADERIPLLLQTPAEVRFVSYEPALEAVDLKLDCIDIAPGYKDGFLHRSDMPHPCEYACGGVKIAGGLDWVIVGGESGPKARPFNIQWARDVVGQCQVAGVACFVKQLGANPFLKVERSYHEETPNLKVHIEQLTIDTTIRLKDSHGGDMSEWPEDLRVRTFPRVS